MAHGSLVNTMLSSSASKEPQVGDGVTRIFWTDRAPGTVVEVERFKTGQRAGQVKAVLVTWDKATRTDSNGMSDAQTYSYETVWDGPRHRFTLRKNGDWQSSRGGRIVIGYREKYYDYSF